MPAPVAPSPEPPEEDPQQHLRFLVKALQSHDPDDIDKYKRKRDERYAVLMRPKRERPT